MTSINSRLRASERRMRHRTPWLAAQKVLRSKPGQNKQRLWWAGIAAFCLWLPSCEIKAELPKPRMPEGCSHGYLVVRDAARRVIASGEYTQTAKGRQLKARLIFRFKDGSVDDETTVYTQNAGFHLVRDHHVQNGPSFPHPLDASLDTSTGQVRFRDQDSGAIKTEKLELPPDLSNGLVLTLITHLGPDSPALEIPYLAESSRPRLTKLLISQDGGDRFKVGPFFHKATRYVIKVELGGLAGIVAPMIGKQPANSYVWIAGVDVPTIVRGDTALFYGGPVLTIEPATPIW